MKDKGIFISFVGSRGAGKTTVANALADKLAELGYSCIRQHRGLSRRPFFKSVLNAIYLWRFFDLELFFALGFRGRKRRLWPSLYRLYMPLAFSSDLHRLSSGEADILIYDSNIMRGLMSAVADGNIEPNSIANLYKRKILPKLSKVVFVFLDTDPEEAINRWLKRDKVTLHAKDRESALTERLKDRDIVRTVLSTLQSLENVSVLYLDGNSDVADNASTIFDHIKH